KGVGIVVFCLIFPTIGLLLSAFATDLWIQHFVFGQSVLVLETRPGVVGRELAAAVEANLRGLEGVDELTAELRCEYKRGRNATVTKWKHSYMIDRSALGRRDAKIRIPCRFRIRADLPESGSGPGWRWKLSLKAATPRNGDYSATFEVPVYRTKESDDPLP